MIKNILFAFFILLLIPYFAQAQSPQQQNSIIPTDEPPQINQFQAFCSDAGKIRKNLNNQQYFRIFRGSLKDNIYLDVFINSDNKYVIFHSRYIERKDKFISCLISEGEGDLAGAAF